MLPLGKVLSIMDLQLDQRLGLIANIFLGGLDFILGQFNKGKGNL